MRIIFVKNIQSISIVTVDQYHIVRGLRNKYVYSFAWQARRRYIVSPSILRRDPTHQNVMHHRALSQTLLFLL